MSGSSKSRRTSTTAGRLGVLERVGERLLDDAVDVEAGGAGELEGLPGALERDGEAGAAHPLDERLEIAPGRVGGPGRSRRSPPAAALAVVAGTVGSSRSTPSMRRMSVRAWRPVLDTSRMASAARSGSAACDGGRVGQRHHDLDVVRDDVMHLAGDAGPLGGRGQRGLLVPLDLQARGAFGQPVQLAAQRAHDDAGEDAAVARPVRKTKRLQVVAGRGPTHRRHDDADLEERSGDDHEEPVALDGDGVQRDEERHVGQGGPVTSHCTNATAAMTTKTAIGARRRKIRGKIRAATTKRFGCGAWSGTSQPEHRTKRTTAIATSTKMAKRRSKSRSRSQTRQARSICGSGPGAAPAAALAVGPEPRGIEVIESWGASDPSFPGETSMLVPAELDLRAEATRSSPPQASPPAPAPAVIPQG